MAISPRVRGKNNDDLIDVGGVELPAAPPTRLDQFRAAYPDYNDVPDPELAESLRGKFYSDMDKPAYYEALGRPELGMGPDDMDPRNPAWESDNLPGTWLSRMGKAGVEGLKAAANKQDFGHLSDESQAGLDQVIGRQRTSNPLDARNIQSALANAGAGALDLIDVPVSGIVGALGQGGQEIERQIRGDTYKPMLAREPEGFAGLKELSDVGGVVAGAGARPSLRPRFDMPEGRPRPTTDMELLGDGPEIGLEGRVAAVDRLVETNRQLGVPVTRDQVAKALGVDAGERPVALDETLPRDPLRDERGQWNPVSRGDAPALDELLAGRTPAADDMGMSPGALRTDGAPLDAALRAARPDSWDDMSGVARPPRNLSDAALAEREAARQARLDDLAARRSEAQEALRAEREADMPAAQLEDLYLRDQPAPDEPMGSFEVKPSRIRKEDYAGEYPLSSALSPATEITTATGRKVWHRGPMDLVTWLRSEGGLKDQAGELSHMGISNKGREGVPFTGNERFMGRIINPNGLNLDDAALRAWERGMLPQFTERPTVDQFLDVLRETWDGRPGRVFRPGDAEDLRVLRERSALDGAISDMGGDPRNMTERQMMAALERRRVADEEARAREIPFEPLKPVARREHPLSAQAEADLAELAFHKEGKGSKLAFDEARDELGDPTPDVQSKWLGLTKGRTVHDVADALVKNGSSEMTRMIAGRVGRQLRRLADAGLNFEYRVITDPKETRLLFPEEAASLRQARGMTRSDPMNGQIRVTINGLQRGALGTSERTNLHELTHAATMSALRLGRSWEATGRGELASATRDLTDVSNRVIDTLNRRIDEAKAGRGQLSEFEKEIWDRRNNALDSIDEVVTWAMTDGRMQQFLESIPYKKNSNLWRAFVGAVRKALGLPARADTALSEVLRVSDILLDANPNEMWNIADHVGTALHLERDAPGAPHDPLEAARRAAGTSEGMTGREAMFDAAQQASQPNAADNATWLRQMPVVGDALKTWTAKVGEPAAQKLETIASTMGLRALGSVPGRDQYLAMRGVAQGAIGRINDAADYLQRTLDKAGPAEREAIYSYLTTRDGDPAAIRSPQRRELAINAKAAIDEIGQEMVRRGVLPAEVVEANRGEYLPRLYLQYVLDPAGFSSSGKRVSNMDYTKARKDIPQEQRELLGEIKDPGFLSARAMIPARDFVVDDLLREVAARPEWVNPQSRVEFEGRIVSTKYLQKQAARHREIAGVQTDEASRAVNLRMADAMDQAIEDVARQTPGADPKLYEEIPDSPRFGALRGMMVRKEIAHDIVGVSDFVAGASGLERALSRHGIAGKATRIWKQTKTSLNLPGHARNFMSAAIQANTYGDVAIPMLPVRLTQAARELRRKGPVYQAAVDNGVLSSTFTSNEAVRFKEFARLHDEGVTGLNAVAQVGLRGIGKGMNVASDIYQGNEVLWKMAVMIDQVSKGANTVQAVRKAQDAIFDYSLVPRGVEVARSNPATGAPFLTFLYKSIGATAETALRRPERFLPYVGLGAMWKALASEGLDVSQEEFDQYMAMLPDYARQSGTTAIMPMRDENGRIQPVDVSYLLPWGSLVKGWNQLQGMVTGEVTPDAGMGLLAEVPLMSMPLNDMLAALRTNVDPFTGREIVNEFDPLNEQIGSVLEYMWNQAVPPWVSSRGAAMRMLDTINGQIDRNGEPGLTPAQASLRFFGLNTNPFNPETQAPRQAYYDQVDVKRSISRARSILRNPGLTPEDRDRKMEEYRQFIDEKARKADARRARMGL